MAETLDELYLRLIRRAEGLWGTPPRREGDDYIWDLADGGEWRTRAFVDQNGIAQVPVGPGIYRSSIGGHFNIPELCKLFELEETEENLAAVMRVVKDAAREAGLPFGGVRISI